MVAGFLPILNLLNQFMKQIAKPVSFRIVRYARSHHIFRQYFLILPGRWFHTLDRRVRKRILGMEKEKIDQYKKEVDVETAINAGANLISEVIVFLIAGLGVIAEVFRSSRNSTAKETMRKEQIQKLINEKAVIMATVKKQTAIISKLKEQVDEHIQLASTTSSIDNPD